MTLPLQKLSRKQAVVLVTPAGTHPEFIAVLPARTPWSRVLVTTPPTPPSLPLVQTLVPIPLALPEQLAPIRVEAFGCRKVRFTNRQAFVGSLPTARPKLNDPRQNLLYEPPTAGAIDYLPVLATAGLVTRKATLKGPPMPAGAVLVKNATLVASILLPSAESLVASTLLIVVSPLTPLTALKSAPLILVVTLARGALPNVPTRVTNVLKLAPKARPVDALKIDNLALDKNT